jgi:hypothetical protein
MPPPDEFKRVLLPLLVTLFIRPGMLIVNVCPSFKL